MLVGIFWRNGVGEKKTPDTFFHGGFRPGQIYTHRPDLDLDFINFVIGNWEIE